MVLSARKDVEFVVRCKDAGGETVKKGQDLVVVESIKMEMVVKSPGDGRVKRVVHGVEEVVGAGVDLVVFEEEAE